MPESSLSVYLLSTTYCILYRISCTRVLAEDNIIHALCMAPPTLISHHYQLSLISYVLMLFTSIRRPYSTELKSYCWLGISIFVWHDMGGTDWAQVVCIFSPALAFKCRTAGCVCGKNCHCTTGPQSSSSQVAQVRLFPLMNLWLKLWLLAGEIIRIMRRGLRSLNSPTVLVNSTSSYPKNIMTMSSSSVCTCMVCQRLRGCFITCSMHHCYCISWMGGYSLFSLYHQAAENWKWLALPTASSEAIAIPKIFPPTWTYNSEKVSVHVSRFSLKVDFIMGQTAVNSHHDALSAMEPSLVAYLVPSYNQAVYGPTLFLSKHFLTSPTQIGAPTWMNQCLLRVCLDSHLALFKQSLNWQRQTLRSCATLSQDGR